MKHWTCLRPSMIETPTPHPREPGRTGVQTSPSHHLGRKRHPPPAGPGRPIPRAHLFEAAMFLVTFSLVVRRGRACHAVACVHPTPTTDRPVYPREAGAQVAHRHIFQMTDELRALVWAPPCLLAALPASVLPPASTGPRWWRNRAGSAKAYFSTQLRSRVAPTFRRQLGREG